MPAGVSSPVRAYEPYPRFISAGRGCKLYDVDGGEYIDFCMAFGPMLLGHAPSPIVRAVKRAVSLGSVFGAPTEPEVALAKKIKSHYPSIEMLRFVNSGTEATMHAIRLMRGYTDRKKVIKIEGAYHGAHDGVLVQAGSGAMTHSVPNSKGVLKDIAKHTILVPFNDADAIRAAIAANADDVAGVILEPILGNVGPIPPADGYLKEVREITEDNGALLIFDEVISGFRVGLGGAQERFNITPDLTTLGKIVGGGYPIGVFGGRKDIMEHLSPMGKVYQAGTFSGNPVSISAGLATIEQLEKKSYAALERKSNRFRKELRKIIEENGRSFNVSGIASMFQIFFTNRGTIRNWDDVKSSDSRLFNCMFKYLLEHGVFIPASQFETNFLSFAHSIKDIDKALNVYDSAIRGLSC